jgi:hypothetical protein
MDGLLQAIDPFFKLTSRLFHPWRVKQHQKQTFKFG